MPAALVVKWQLSKEIEAGRMSEQDLGQAYAARLASLPEGAGSVFALPMRSRDEVLYVASLSAKARPANPVLLAEGARFRIQGSVRSPAVVVIGVGASDAERSNSGRFLTRRPVDGAFDLDVPVKELDAGNRPAVGLDLLNWLAYTTEREAELAVTGVELIGESSVEIPLYANGVQVRGAFGADEIDNPARLGKETVWGGRFNDTRAGQPAASRCPMSCG